MECRICHQPIGFIRGRFPERKKTTTLAVHESEMAALLEQGNRNVVAPHPGAQRKLRQELEANHRGGSAQTGNTATTTSDHAAADTSPEEAEPSANAEPLADQVNNAAKNTEGDTDDFNEATPPRAQQSAPVTTTPPNPEPQTGKQWPESTAPEQTAEDAGLSESPRLSESEHVESRASVSGGFK